MTTFTLTYARRLYQQGDNLYRAAVKTRIWELLRTDPQLDLDSVFIKAVAAEQRCERLP